jgi:transcriptional regulator NrdR family protein
MYATFSRLQEIDTMSELQSEDSGITFDEPEAQEAQTVEAEQPEVNEPSALATDSPVEGEENTTDSVEQEKDPEWFEKKINKSTFHRRQAERERDALREENEKLKASSQPVLSNVDIPPIPDSWDENYEAKIRERDTAIQQKARFEHSESQRLANQAEAQRKSEREHFNRQQELSETLASNSKKLGIDKVRLDSAQEVLVKQISDSGRDMTRIVDRLLSDPMGGLMIQHLATNQLDMHDIIYASPEDAGFLLAEVKQKASLLKPKSSSAPSPATTLTGRAAPQRESWDKGNTYE